MIKFLGTLAIASLTLVVVIDCVRGFKRKCPLKLLIPRLICSLEDSSTFSLELIYFFQFTPVLISY